MEKSIREEIKEKYRAANRRLVLLDYDGTLVKHTSIPYTTRLSEHLFDILIKIVGTPQTELFIITGRSFKEIDKILDHLPIDIIAEHGAMIKENGIWKNKINENCAWKETIIPILNQVTSSCPNSFVEEKSYSLTWHYRNAELQSGFDYSRELIRILESTLKSFNLKILDGNKVVEIMTKEVGKGRAVQKLFEQNNYDFTLSIGDDVTDEEMFEYFLHISNAFTIKVGKGGSFAKYNLTGINDVLSLLKHLSA
jgi:trehalose 6-phosphate synthase/phosphatase